MPRTAPSAYLAAIAAFAIAAFAVAAGTAPPAAAQDSATPLTGDEFDSRTTGRTFTFAIDGTPYGIERYLENRRVIWAFMGEECREGRWFTAGPHICFVYDDEPGRNHCWTFLEGATGLMAQVAGADDAAPMVEVAPSPELLHCPGPRVGV